MWINCRKCGQLMDDCFTIPDCVCFDCWDEAEANGELYYCSDCGQVSALPLKNDKCEECSSRSASSGKKKKPKIQKAAALIMAMMIALSCLTFSAFADFFESDVFVTDGTYMGYDIIKYNLGDLMYNKTFFNYFDSKYNYADNPDQRLGIALLDFDSSGNPYLYTLYNNSFGVYISFDGDKLHSLSFTNKSYPCEISSSATYFRHIYFSFNSDDFYYNFTESSSPDNKYEFNRTLYCNGSEFTGYQDSEKYLILIPYEYNYETVTFEKLLSGTKDDFVGAEPKPEAGFITAKTPEPGKITVIDWVGAGTQYPLFDFWINDNKCYDTYVLRISSNDSYTQRLYDKGQTDHTIDWLGYNSSFGTQQISWLFQALNYDQLQWDVERNITDASFTFAETDISNRRGYTICLSDYLTIVEYLLYRAEIIDISTGKLVAVTYFSTNRNYNKGSSGFGSKVSHYTDDNNTGWDTDLSDGKFGNANETEDKGNMTVDNKNDIVVTYDPQGLSLDSFMDSLEGLTSNIGNFFQSVWGLFPPEIMTLLTIGVGLILTCGAIKFFFG